MRRIRLAWLSLVLAGCSGSTEPPEAVSKTDTGITLCRDPSLTTQQAVEDAAAKYCSASGLKPQLTMTTICGEPMSRFRNAYTYTCVKP